MIMFWPDIPRVSGAAFILSANITHTVKLATLILNRDTFVSLVDFFVDSLSKRNLKDPKVLNIIISYEKIAFRDIVVILGLTTVAVIALVGVGDLMDPSGLPLVAWYPFEVNYSPMFELVFVHQMFAVLVAASLNVTLDMFTNNMVLQLCCQFELLKRDIEVIREISPEDHEEITRQLGDLIDRLCVLKRKCVELSQSCGVPVLAQFMGSIFIICISFYQFQRATETSIITIIAIFSMVMWAVLQAFFYCYYGNEIKTEVGLIYLVLIIAIFLIFNLHFQSQSIALALMQLPWYRFSQKNKKIFLLMTSMAQKPIILRAAGVINITLDALMSVSRTQKWNDNAIVL